MIGQRDWFKNFVELQESISIKLRNEVEITAHGKGDIDISAFTGARWEEKYLKDVLYVPKLA